MNKSQIRRIQIQGAKAVLKQGMLQLNTFKPCTDRERALVDLIKNLGGLATDLIERLERV